MTTLLTTTLILAALFLVALLVGHTLADMLAPIQAGL